MLTYPLLPPPAHCCHLTTQKWRKEREGRGGIFWGKDGEVWDSELLLHCLFLYFPSLHTHPTFAHLCFPMHSLMALKKKNMRQHALALGQQGSGRRWVGKTPAGREDPTPFLAHPTFCLPYEISQAGRGGRDGTQNILLGGTELPMHRKGTHLPLQPPPSPLPHLRHILPLKPATKRNAAAPRLWQLAAWQLASLATLCFLPHHMAFDRRSELKGELKRLFLSSASPLPLIYTSLCVCRCYCACLVGHSPRPEAGWLVCPGGRTLCRCVGVGDGAGSWSQPASSMWSSDPISPVTCDTSVDVYSLYCGELVPGPLFIDLPSVLLWAYSGWVRRALLCLLEDSQVGGRQDTRAQVTEEGTWCVFVCVQGNSPSIVPCLTVKHCYLWPCVENPFLPVSPELSLLGCDDDHVGYPSFSHWCLVWPCHYPTALVLAHVAF